MGSHDTKPGQSRTTLNLTASAATLIDCPAPHPSHSSPAENPVGEASELGGQTDGRPGTVVPGQFADNHRTARSEGNHKRQQFNDLNISSQNLPTSSPVVQSIIRLPSEIIIGGGPSFFKGKVNSSSEPSALQLR